MNKRIIFFGGNGGNSSNNQAGGNGQLGRVIIIVTWYEQSDYLNLGSVLKLTEFQDTH